MLEAPDDVSSSDASFLPSVVSSNHLNLYLTHSLHGLYYYITHVYTCYICSVRVPDYVGDGCIAGYAGSTYAR